MRRNVPENVHVHLPDNINFHSLAQKVSAFHVEVIKRRLRQSELTTEQKILVIDRIIQRLKLREVNGIIK